MSGNIYIPKPCHENWNNMSVEEKGRHCAVCSKVVKDFTGMQKKEIIDVLKETTGEVCGRIKANEVTPTKKQQASHVIQNWLFRKGIYPIMALLGFSLINKKASAQIVPHKMGKMAYNDYHTNNKKITVVVKHTNGNVPIPNATVQVVGGVRKQIEALTTSALGKAVFELSANNLNSESIEVEVTAPGYETKIVTIQLIKEVQTVEIRMENELMMMGEMMYIPEPDTPIENMIVKQVDTTEKVQIVKCSKVEIIQLPKITEQDTAVLNMVPIEYPMDENTNVLTEADLLQIENQTIGASFNVFPVPANDMVNITTNSGEKFNLDLFDENGKKILAVGNAIERYQMNVSNYSSGVYYLLIHANGKAIETKKIIVTH